MQFSNQKALATLAVQVEIRAGPRENRPGRAGADGHRDAPAPAMVQAGGGALGVV
jgi:hypothetical protein